MQLFIVLALFVSSPISAMKCFEGQIAGTNLQNDLPTAAVQLVDGCEMCQWTKLESMLPGRKWTQITWECHRGPGMSCTRFVTLTEVADHLTETSCQCCEQGCNDDYMCNLIGFGGIFKPLCAASTRKG